MQGPAGRVGEDEVVEGLGGADDGVQAGRATGRAVPSASECSRRPRDLQ